MRPPTSPALSALTWTPQSTEAGKATMKAATEGLDDTLILVCYSGKKYAQAATNALSANGYDMSKVFTLEGGFNNWSEVQPDHVEP